MLHSPDTTFRSTGKPREAPEINTGALKGSGLRGLWLSRDAGTRRKNGNARKLGLERRNPLLDRPKTRKNASRTVPVLACANGECQCRSSDPVQRNIRKHVGISLPFTVFVRYSGSWFQNEVCGGSGMITKCACYYQRGYGYYLGMEYSRSLGNGYTGRRKQLKADQRPHLRLTLNTPITNEKGKSSSVKQKPQKD